MKRYRYALSVTSQFYFCGVPFRLDISPKCALNCSYCFAMARGGRKTSNSLITDAKYFSRKLEKVFIKKKIIDINDEMILQRIPIHLGGISDPFSDKKTSHIVKEVLKTLIQYNYPVIISTKNTNALMDAKIIALLKGAKKIAVQISLVTNDIKMAKLIEPHIKSPLERIKAIRMLSLEGIYTIVRLQPLFFPWIKEVASELIPNIGLAGCKHIIVEYLKLPVEKSLSLINEMLRQIKWDAYNFYRKNGALLIGREWVLPSKFKLQNLAPIIKAIHRYGMLYGAGDYGLTHLGDTSCCCGIDVLDGFSNWHRGNFSNVIRSSKTNFIRFSEVEKYWFPKKSIAMVMNSNSRLKDHNRIIDYLKKKWNSPGTVNAPDSFFGVSWSKKYDHRGDCIYIKGGKNGLYMCKDLQSN